MDLLYEKYKFIGVPVIIDKCVSYFNWFYKIMEPFRMDDASDLCDILDIVNGSVEFDFPHPLLSWSSRLRQRIAHNSNEAHLESVFRAVDFPMYYREHFFEEAQWLVDMFRGCIENDNIFNILDLMQSPLRKVFGRFHKYVNYLCVFGVILQGYVQVVDGSLAFATDCNNMLYHVIINNNFDHRDHKDVSVMPACLTLSGIPHECLWDIFEYIDRWCPFNLSRSDVDLFTCILSKLLSIFDDTLFSEEMRLRLDIGNFVWDRKFPVIRDMVNKARLIIEQYWEDLYMHSGIMNIMFFSSSSCLPDCKRVCHKIEQIDAIRVSYAAWILKYKINWSEYLLVGDLIDVMSDKDNKDEYKLYCGKAFEHECFQKSFLGVFAFLGMVTDGRSLWFDYNCEGKVMHFPRMFECFDNRFVNTEVQTISTNINYTIFQTAAQLFKELAYLWKDTRSVVEIEEHLSGSKGWSTLLYMLTMKSFYDGSDLRFTNGDWATWWLSGIVAHAFSGGYSNLFLSPGIDVKQFCVRTESTRGVIAVDFLWRTKFNVLPREIFLLIYKYVYGHMLFGNSTFKIRSGPGFGWSLLHIDDDDVGNVVSSESLFFESVIPEGSMVRRPKSFG